MIKSCLGLLLCSILVGCISHRAGMHEPVKSWKLGDTTPKDVVSEWGNPDSIKGNIWVWKERIMLGGAAKVAYMKLGFSVSNHEVCTREHHLRFDENGKLKSAYHFDSIAGGASWSLNPWKK